MRTKPRLLFLSQTLPYPPDGGVKIRTFHVLRLLANAFEVTGLCFYRRSLNPEPQTGVAALARLGALEAFPIPQEHNVARLALDHLRSVLGRRVYTVYAYESQAYRRRLRALLGNEQFDLVHADSLDLSGYFAMLGDRPLACVHHDVQSTLLRRRATHEPRRIARWVAAHQAGLMAKEERSWCSRVSLNVTVSTVDRDELQQRAPAGRFTVVPNGVDTEYFRPERGAENGIVFVGGASWLPNADGMQYFCDAILPNLRAGGARPAIRWVGRVDEKRQRFFTRTYGVEVTGYVHDVRPFVRDAACYIVPLRIGGGTRIKILDAWAMGKAVVSTSIGCEGLEARDGENILVRDDPLEFADAVTQVLRDGELRRRLGQAARRTAESIYSWEGIGQGLITAYLGLLRPKAR